MTKEQSPIQGQLDSLNQRYEKLKKERALIAKEKMKRKGINDLIYLSKKILGAYNIGDIHYEWKRILEDFWEDKEERLLLLLAPRGSLKSSIVTINWTIQRMVEDPNIRVLITNEKEENAKRFLKVIADQLRYNKMFRHVYGDLTTKKNPWNEFELTVRTRTVGHKEPTVAIGSIDKSPVSQHYDLIIGDDLQSRLNTQTKEQIFKVWQYWKDLLSLLEPGHGKRVLIGTRWSFGDIYSKVLERLTPNDILNNKNAVEELRKQYV